MPIGSKWMYKTKQYPDGSTQYKVQLVIKEYKQTVVCVTYALHRQKCKSTISCATRTHEPHSKLPMDPCATVVNSHL